MHANDYAAIQAAALLRRVQGRRFDARPWPFSVAEVAAALGDEEGPCSAGEHRTRRLIELLDELADLLTGVDAEIAMTFAASVTALADGAWALQPDPGIPQVEERRS